MVELTGRSLLPYLGAASRRSGQLWKQAGLAVGLLVVAVALVGCSAVVQQGKDVEVTRVQFVKFWAFTVESGILKCLNATERRKGEAILDVNGVTYALNETAEKAGHSPIDVIIAPHPSVEGTKINYHKFIELAEEECF